MSSLFGQAKANSTDKPALTKYGHTAAGEVSGMDVKPSALSAGKPQGGQKTEAKAMKMPMPEVQTPTPSMKKVQSGIEYFQP
ncbi:hypothetical protein F4818DRAFT_439421 [Hypoxylon cercidicola]|nr:hypothetical protein F4818DRAFT_439421 [Hypoxylon cercidicola]